MEYCLAGDYLMPYWHGVGVWEGDHSGQFWKHDVEGNMGNSLGNTHDSHYIAYHVEGEITHNLNIRLICGAVGHDGK